MVLMRVCGYNASTCACCAICARYRWTVGRESLQAPFALLIGTLVSDTIYPTQYRLPFQINGVLGITFIMVLIHCPYVSISKVELCSEVRES
jgi:hypothetical protein